jgi:septation ring formation regulator EzrA
VPWCLVEAANDNMNEIKDLLDNLKAKLDKEKEMQKKLQESADDLKEKIRLAREQAQSVSTSSRFCFRFT